MKIRLGALSLVIFCLTLVGTAQQTQKVSQASVPDLTAFLEGRLVSDTEVYRFTVWPTFSNPILIRVEKQGDGAAVVTKVLKGHGGYQEGSPVIERETRFTISERKFSRIRNAFRDAKLETLPAKDTKYDPAPDGTAWICLDGANWNMEQIVDGRYSHVQRYCPEEKKLHEIGFMLLKVSQLKFKNRDLF